MNASKTLLALLALLAVGCAQSTSDVRVSGSASSAPPAAATETAPEKVDPQPCGLALDPVPQLLAETTVSAARWSAATGCDVRVEVGGLPVRFATPEELTMEDGGHARGVASFGDDGQVKFIGYRSGSMNDWTVDMTLTHELGHALGCHSHTNDGSVLDSPSQLYSKITANALECVCASLNCEVFVPEA